jgi:hypothetical protein
MYDMLYIIINCNLGGKSCSGEKWGFNAQSIYNNVFMKLTLRIAAGEY